jgi:hypothetical protein
MYNLYMCVHCSMYNCTICTQCSMGIEFREWILRRYDTGTTWTGDFKCREVKTGFCRKRWLQTGSSGTLIGWKSGQTTYVPLWDRMEGSWLRTLYSTCAEGVSPLRPPTMTQRPVLGGRAPSAPRHARLTNSSAPNIFSLVWLARVSINQSFPFFIYFLCNFTDFHK